MDVSTEYFSLSDLLSQSGSPLLLAELHGGLCGVICAGGRDAGASWLDDVLDDCTADASTLSELAERLGSLVDSTWQTLNGNCLEFAPLLPGDDSAIDMRADALALWCHGFLAGLVVGGLDLVSGSERVSDEMAELVRDFAEISKAGADAGEIEDEEVGARALTELVEFVRVGAQYCFEEMMAKSDATPKRTIH
jgi:yecA family protein